METDEFTAEWLSIRQGLNPCDPFKIRDAINAILKTTVTNPELWENELVLTIHGRFRTEFWGISIDFCIL